MLSSLLIATVLNEKSYQDAVHVKDERNMSKRMSNSGGGNFTNFIHKEFSGRNPYYTILT